MADDLDYDIEAEVVFGNEFSAKDRCQQLGIQIENARRGAGDDRFKYLCLLVILFLRKTVSSEDFDDSFLYSFFEKIVPFLIRIGNMRYKNPICVVLATFICVDTSKSDIVYHFNLSKFQYVLKTVVPQTAEYLKKNGVGSLDLIRYIRMFETSL
jgi:hypothetical protein